MKLLLPLFFVVATSLFGFNLESYRTGSDSLITIFNDVCFANKGDGLRFVLNSPKDENIFIKYYEDDIFVDSFEEKVSSNVPFYIPSKNKSIILSGTSKRYKFEFIAKSNKRTVSVLMNTLGDDFSSNKIKLMKQKKASKSLSFSLKKSLNSYTPKTSLSNNNGSVFFQELVEYKIETTRASASELFKSIAPSVVLIQTEEGSGSGTIIDNNGTILTNYHVIEGNDQVNVYFKPSKYSNVSLKEAHLADVIKYDITKDLALIKLRKMNKNLEPVGFDEFDGLEVAQKVHAIGHPHGEQWTYTQGVVSQIRKDYQWSGGRYKNIADVVQTQTPINPGNSGGPLIGDTGKIIGVNSFKDSRGQGLNYAVAVSSVKSFLDDDEAFKYSEELDDKSSQEVPEPVILDLDEDGNGDSLGYDSNNDGNIDIILTDYLEDSDIFLTLISDTNYNGIPDRRKTVESYDGEYYYITYVDLDEDGTEDVYEFDFDMDGKVDKRILADEE